MRQSQPLEDPPGCHLRPLRQPRPWPGTPRRVADVTKPVTIELPGIVHRFAQGHHLAVVLAGGDWAYRGSNASQPVTLITGGTFLQKLTVPVV